MSWQSESGLDASTSISLINRVKLRDQIAWQRLTVLYTPIVYGWLRSSQLSQEDSADIVQEVFQSVVKSLPDFGRDGKPTKFRAWLWGITRNRLMDHYRAKNSQPQAIGGSEVKMMLSELPHEAPESSSGEADALTQRALRLIQTDFRETTWQAFWRVAVEEQAPADVAADLGMTVAAVYTAKSRVLAHLRIELQGLI